MHDRAHLSRSLSLSLHTHAHMHPPALSHIPADALTRYAQQQCACVTAQTKPQKTLFERRETERASPAEGHKKKRTKDQMPPPASSAARQAPAG